MDSYACHDYHVLGVTNIDPYLPIILINTVLTVAVLALIVYFMTGEQPEIPSVDELFAKLKASDHGMLAGRNKLNKKIDTVMGNYILEQFPIAQLVMDRVPKLGEIMVKNPETISYIQSKANEWVGKMGGNLPGDIGGFLQKLMGANIGELIPQQPKQEL